MNVLEFFYPTIAPDRQCVFSPTLPRVQEVLMIRLEWQWHWQVVNYSFRHSTTSVTASRFCSQWGMSCGDDLNCYINIDYRQFSVKEIAFINRFYDNSLSFITNEETGTDKTHSIDRLTEGFIASLTSDFPSTIFTIARTAEKMTNIATDDEKKQCQFCGVSLSDVCGGFRTLCLIELLQVPHRPGRTSYGSQRHGIQLSIAASDSVWGCPTCQWGPPSRQSLLHVSIDPGRGLCPFFIWLH